MPQTIKKSLRMPEDLCEFIDEAGKAEYRDFTSMVEVLLRKGKEAYEAERKTIDAIRSGNTQISPEIIGRKK